MKTKKSKRPLRGIFRFIDRLIVVPITKLILKISTFFGKGGLKLENWLSNQNTLLFISLLLSALIFITIDQRIITFSHNSAEVLKSQTVTAIYNEEAYVIEGLPETVDITLIGSKTDLFIARQIPTYNIKVDLTGLKPGTHEVAIKYNDALTNIDYRVNPSVATVIIYPKLSETRHLTVDVINRDKLDSKLAIENISVPSDQVVVKGAEHQLSKVVAVKALVDVDDLVEQKAGVSTISEVKLRAYDLNGEIVDVEIVPATVEAQVTIASPHKEMPIKFIPKGNLAFGHAISGYTLSNQTVVVYGPTDVLDKLNFIPLEVDVSDLKANKEFRLDLIRPVGVTALSTTTVRVDVRVGSQSTSYVDNVKINFRNLAPGLTVQAASSKDVSVTVNLKGHQSIIKNIKADNVTAYVDLNGLAAGTHDVEVMVEGDEPIVEYLSMTRRVTLRIIKQ